MLHRTLAPEVELHVVQGISDFLEWGVGVETGIVLSQDVTDVAQAQPFAVYIIIWPTEGFAYHFYQVVQFLEGLVLLDQRLYLGFVQPIALTRVKEMERLGIEPVGG